MKYLLRNFMKEYLNNYDELVDSGKDYYKLLELLTEMIQKKLSNDYLVKGSCGQGRKAECPWICVFNKNVTTGARKGIYYAVLFKSDMSGFYLSLCLGMESFKEKFKSEWEVKLKTVADYFRLKINEKNFNLKQIDLNVDKNTRGYGYEISNIVAKYYEFGKNEGELENDINLMTKIYSNICEMMSSISYSEVIDNILSYSNVSLIDIDLANQEIEQSILKEANLNSAELISLRETTIPTVKDNNGFVEIARRKIKKVDYLKNVKKQINVGLRGEQLVFEYEKQKMILNGRSDLIEKIKWVSEVDDSLGYDIESFDFDDNGNAFKIYIEVKSTDINDKNVFFISANEINVMKKLSDKYWIYRIFKVNDEPTFFKVNGKDFFEKFLLCAYTYTAKII